MLSTVTYMGSISHTVDGRQCDRWNSADPDLYDVLKNAMPDLPEWNVMETNYCRHLVLNESIKSKLKVPDSFNSPWCLVDGTAHLCVTPQICGKSIPATNNYEYEKKGQWVIIKIHQPFWQIWAYVPQILSQASVFIKDKI